MKTKNSFLIVLVIMTIVFGLSSCKEDESTSIAVSDISLDKTNLTLSVGEEYTLTATISPSNAADKTITWTSSDATKALVSNGKVTAMANGTVIISAKAGNKTAICTIININNTQVNPDGITGTVTDIEGNVYKTIKIGNQWWMAENLKVSKYNDDIVIPNITDGTAWATLTTGAYCDYDNSTANRTKYGHLYNWYTVNTGKLAPVGWHVPSTNEWGVLQDYLIANGYNYDGTTTDNKIAKSIATKTDWAISTEPGSIGNDLSLNNSSGFSALPAGERDYNGTFESLGLLGYWWSTTVFKTYPCYMGLFYNYVTLNSYYYYYKNYGYSVRCVRN